MIVDLISSSSVIESDNEFKKFIKIINKRRELSRKEEEIYRDFYQYINDFIINIKKTIFVNYGIRVFEFYVKFDEFMKDTENEVWWMIFNCKYDALFLDSIIFNTSDYEKRINHNTTEIPEEIIPFLMKMFSEKQITFYTENKRISEFKYDINDNNIYDIKVYDYVIKEHISKSYEIPIKEEDE